jgi:hypothetical protein
VFASNACIEAYIISLADNRVVKLERSRTKTTMKCEEKGVSEGVNRRDDTRTRGGFEDESPTDIMTDWIFSLTGSCSGWMHA